MRKQMLVLMVLSMVLWSRLPAARAATFTVSNLNDSGAGSLRNTIVAATANSTITFNVSGTITLTSGQISISKSLTIDGSGQSVTVSGNDASRVFFVEGNISVEFRHLTIAHGAEIQSSGGAIANDGAMVTITDSTVTNNVAIIGAGVLNTTGSTLTIENSVFSNNTTDNAGSAVNSGGTLVIRNSTFTDNSSGGGTVHNYGSATISQSTFANNVAAFGGGITNVEGTLSIDNSTFFGNDSNQPDTSHIYNSASTAVISNSTFAASAARPAGLMNNSGATLTISASIFHNSVCTNSSSTLNDGGNNMAFNAAGCPGTNADPLLGTLGNNGGLTQTIPLLAGSPALNAYSTNCPATDQRGVTRPQGTACDIGAFELESVTESSISENEFYAALEAARTGFPDIQRVVVDFVPGAMNLTVVTATAGTGTVNVTLTQQDGFVTFNIASITVNGTPAPASYTSIINRDLPNLLVLALDSLVMERFGGGADVQAMTLTASALVVEIGG